MIGDNDSSRDRPAKQHQSMYAYMPAFENHWIKRNDEKDGVLE